jgi:hypothetical protein
VYLGGCIGPINNHDIVILAVLAIADEVLPGASGEFLDNIDLIRYIP